MADLQELLDVLEMRPTGERSYEAGSISFGGGPTVFGGQLMAQAIVAGATIDLNKEVRSLHTVFARPAQVRPCHWRYRSTCSRPVDPLPVGPSRFDRGKRSAPDP